MQTLIDYLRALRDDADDWCQGRSYFWRLGLLALLAYLGFRYATIGIYGSIFSGLILGIHELGHVIFRPAGELLMVAGGSLCQVLAPLIAACVLWISQRDYFGVAVAGCWLSFSLYELSAYIGDARSRVLPLVSIGGGDAEHDWTYLLERFNLLEFDARLATMTRALALVALLSSLTFGIWLCYRMARSRSAHEPI